jgi:hypothetical protein
MVEVSIGTRGVTCGKCGSKLSVHKTDTEPKPGDRVVCPIHGDIGNFGDVSTEAFTRVSESIGSSLSKALGIKLH